MNEELIKWLAHYGASERFQPTTMQEKLMKKMFSNRRYVILKPRHSGWRIYKNHE